MEKEMRDLVELAVAQGWTVTPTNNEKIIWKPADPEIRQVVSHIRVGKGRARQNLLADLKRSGLQLTPEPRTATEFAADAHEHNSPMTATIVEAAIEGLGIEPGSKADTITGVFIGTMLAAVMDFCDDIRPINPEIKADLEKAEQLYLETCNQLEASMKHSEKLQSELSRLGKEMQKLMSDLASTTERANKAEQKLKMFRSALSED